VPSFIEHIEEYLGPIQGGTGLREGVQAAWFADCPSPGSTAVMTLGLSHHAFHQAEGPDVRMEMIIAWHGDAAPSLNGAGSVLADICDRIVPAHHAPPRGTVFGPGGRFFPGSEVEALYCSLPTYFSEELAAFDGFPEPFLPIWLVPITPDEARFVREQGWQAFEDLWEEAGADMLNVMRPSLVPANTRPSSR
jgi:suppressor of fused protein SUFU